MLVTTIDSIAYILTSDIFFSLSKNASLEKSRGGKYAETTAAGPSSSKVVLPSI